MTRLILATALMLLLAAQASAYYVYMKASKASANQGNQGILTFKPADNAFTLQTKPAAAEGFSSAMKQILNKGDIAAEANDGFYLMLRLVTGICCLFPTQNTVIMLRRNIRLFISVTQSFSHHNKWKYIEKK